MTNTQMDLSAAPIHTCLTLAQAVAEAESALVACRLSAAEREDCHRVLDIAGMSATLHGLVPTSHNPRRQVAHIAAVVPGDPPTWDVPGGERIYLCGRPAAQLHVRSFPWSDRDEYPTCKRCRKAAAEAA